MYSLSLAALRASKSCGAGVKSASQVTKSTYGMPTTRLWCKKALLSQESAQNTFRSVSTSMARYYSTASAHPVQSTSTTTVPILESLTSSISAEKLTQEKLCLKLDDLVPVPDSFAVVHIGGKQYKVTQGDVIMVESMEAPVAAQILLDKVLLLGTKEYTVIGKPLLTSAKVLAQVEEHEKTEKVIIYKKKRRKGYQTKNGHRQPYTLLRIQDIMGAKVAPQ